MEKTRQTAKPKASSKKTQKAAGKAAAQKTARKPKKTDRPPGKIHYCSFCKRPSSELLLLISGPNNVFICEECTQVCVKIFLDVSPKEWEQILTDILANPKIEVELPPAKRNKKQTSKKGKENK